MTAPPDGIGDPHALIASLRAERDAALAGQIALAEVMELINRNPADLEAVFNAVLDSLLRLADAAFGSLETYHGDVARLVAARGTASIHLGIEHQVDAGTLMHRIVLGEDIVALTDVRNDEAYRMGAPGRVRAVDVYGARTLLTAALRKEERLLGFINIYRTEVKPFTEAQLALVKAFAAQAAIAMENARLATELREALEQQTATAEVLQTINTSPSDLGPVFEAMVEKAKRLCEAAYGSLWIRDGTQFHATAVRDLPPAFVEFHKTPLDPVPGTGAYPLVMGEDVIHIGNLAEDDGYLAHNHAKRALYDLGDARTVLFVALRKEASLRGFFMLYRREVRPFSTRQIGLLENFAAQAVIAMENARLLDELRQRTAELAERNTAFAERIEHQSATIDVLKAMSSTPDDTQPVFDLITRRAQQLCGGMSAGLLEFDGELVHLRSMASGLDTAAVAGYRAAFPMALTRGSIPCRAILDRQIVHVRDMDADPGLLQVVRDLGVKSVVAIPLMRDGLAIGAFSINTKEPGGFNDSQIALLQTFAEQAVIAITSVANFRALRERTAELAQRQAELRLTFENMGDGVAMFDETPCLIAWNRKFQELLDVPAEALEQHRTFDEYIRYLTERGEYGQDADPDEQVRRFQAIRGQSARFERMRANGRVIEVRQNPVADGGFVLIYTDITERKRAEAEIAAARDAAEAAARTIEAAYRELKAAQANLVQAEKMASLGQLTAGIAHEIKNPLNFVNNFAALSVDLLGELTESAAPGLALLEAEQRADVDEIAAMLTGNLEKIAEHGRRADGIVRSMLEHSRGGSGERRSVDLNTLVEEALNLAYHGARAQDQSFNITLERDFADGMAPVTLTPQDITRVLLNLCGNGFYAARKRQQDEPGITPVLRVTTRDLGDAVEIRVRDNGIGVAPEIRDRLFQPFFTTKPTGEGTGLGLSISYDIVVKQHGGTITVDSEPGAFTEFVVTLPRVMAAQERARA